MKSTYFLDINGYETEIEVKRVVAYRVSNEDTGKERHFLSFGDGYLFHPKLSVAEISRQNWKFRPCTKEQYTRYKTFMNKRNEITYNKLMREL